MKMPGGTMPYSRVLHVLAGVVIGASLGALLWTNIDAKAVWRLLERASAGPIVLAILALAADFLLRAVRFHGMLKVAAGRPLPLRRCIWPFIASFGISDILPLRAGDAYRVMWFHRRLGLPVSKVIGAMAVERILDLLAVLLLGMVAVMLAGTAIPPMLVKAMHVVIGAIGFGVLAVIVAPRLLPAPNRESAGTAARWLAMGLDGCRSISAAMGEMMRPGSGSLFVVLTLICWSFEYLVFHLAWISLEGMPGAIAQPLLAFSFSTLGTLVPGLPGHFGSFEYFGFMAFTLAGVEPAFGTAVLLLAHLCLWLPTALCGVIWMLMEGFGSSDRARKGART